MNRILKFSPTPLSLGTAVLMLLSLTPAHALDGDGPVNATLGASWSAYEVVTSGDNPIPGDGAYGTTMTRSQFDGLGAWVTGDTLRVYVNHETTPASISRVDLDLARFKQSVASHIDGGSTPASIVTQIALAYDAIYDGSYHAVSNPGPVASGYAEVNAYGNNLNNFARFCSGGVHQADTFGVGKGFADTLYMTGEESSGGKGYALECATGDLWEIDAFGAHNWENFAPIDTGNTTHTAVALWADNTNSPVAGDYLMIYVGRKGIDTNGDEEVDFLERNGLRGGTIYYFDPVAGAPDGDLPNGTENFVLTENTDLAEYESKLEDIHTNPANGKQLVFNAQLDGLYIMDVDIQFDDVSGNVLPGASTVSITSALTDDNTVATFDDPDNLTWSPSGYIYVQEDGGMSPSNELWRFRPSDPAGTLTWVGQGHTETSGIIDVSELAGFPHNTVFLFSVMGGSGMSQLVTLVNTEAICPSVAPATQVGSVTDSELYEISGVAASSTNPDTLWVHNDGGNDPELYALSTSGALLGTYTLEGVTTNIDWEDMAVGPGPDPSLQYLYIADTGDNGTNRNSVTIYRVPEPDRAVQPSGVLTGVDALVVKYPGNPYDCETLLVDPLSRDIVLVTRDRSSSGTPRVSRVFGYPYPQDPQTTFTLIEHPASALSTFWDIKGGDVSRTGDQVILRPSEDDTSVDGMLWTRAPGTKLWDVFSQAFCFVPLAAEQQGEAVSFNAAGTGYYTISEEVGSGFSPVPVYFYGIISDNHPPVADSQNLVTNEDVPLSITFAATDEDGDPLTYTVVDGPAAGTLSVISGDQVTYSPDLNFNRTDAFTFVANDGTANSAVATVTITVNPINDAPLADAGPEQWVFENAPVSLDGTNSSDPDGDPISYEWTQIGGPAVELSAAIAAEPSFLAPAVSQDTTLVFSLVVSDATSSSLADTVSVTVSQLNYDAFVLQEPTVIDGTVNGSIDDTADSDGQVQTVTEASSGRKGRKRLEVEYLLQTIAPPASITSLKLNLVHAWTDQDSPSESLEAFVWNTSGSGGWEEISSTLLGSGVTDLSGSPGSPNVYVDGNHIRVLFRDSAEIQRERADTLSIDALWADIEVGTPDTEPPAAPTGLVGTAGEFVVNLDWDDNTEDDLLGYSVWRRSGTQFGEYTALNADPIQVSAFQDDTVTSATTYYYVVTAHDVSLNRSEDSQFVEVTTGDLPPTAQPSLHVQGVTVQATRKGKNWKGDADVTIVDQDGAPLAGAVVTGEWSFNGQPNSTGTVLTAANGIAVLTSSPEKANSGEFQFEVTGVALVGYTDATDYTDTSVTTASVTFP